MSRRSVSLLLLVLLVSGSPLMALVNVGGVPVANAAMPVPVAISSASVRSLDPGPSATQADMASSRAGRSGPDVTPWNITFNDTDTSWFGYGVGVVGSSTKIEHDVWNNGDVDATNVNVKIEIKDYFNNVINTYTTTVAKILLGTKAHIIWPDWTPTVTQKIYITVTTTVTGDTNTANDDYTFYGNGIGLWVDKWLDMADSESGWSGDLAINKWHITSKVPTDPKPSDHSAPKVWYMGTEGVIGDYYTPNMNASLISKPVDLKRMIPTNPVFLNFKYYGETLPGDDLRVYASIDNGKTWMDTRTVITGATQNLGTPEWFYRTCNWVDMNRNGVMDPNEYEVGMDISEFIGHDVRFKFTFRSGQASTGLGYFLDDFIVVGFESDHEVAIMSIDDMGTTHVDETETIVGNFVNLGVAATPALTARLSVYNTTGLMEQLDQPLASIPAGGTVKATWNRLFDTKGDYWVDVGVLQLAQGMDGTSYDNGQERRVHVSSGGAGVLLVDDDGGPTNSGRLHYWGYYVDSDDAIVRALEANGLEFDVYHVLYNSEGPGMSVLRAYHTIIWSTGWDGTGRSILGTFGPGDRATLRQYLGAGGSLWLMSQETVYDLMDADPSFLRDTLHLTSYQDDAGFPQTLKGVPGNEISNGWSFDGQVPVPANDRTDAIMPASPNKGMTYESDTIQSSTTGPFDGANYNGSCKIVYTAFDITYLKKDKDRTTMTGAITHWLYAGLTVEMASQTKNVDAGGSVNYTFMIRNMGSANKTVRDLSVVSVSDEWTANITPSVVKGVPKTIVPGYHSINGVLRVRSPKDAAPNVKGTAVLRLVVDETGEVLQNTTVSVVKATPKMNITVSPKDQVGEVGRNASYLVSIVNTGNVRVTINLTLNGTIQTWASFDKAYLIIDPGKQDSTVITLSVPPDATAGNHSLLVVAEGRYQGQSVLASDSLNISVKKFHSLAITTVRATEGGRVDPNTPSIDIFLELDNKGNGYDKVTLSLSGTFINEEKWGWGRTTVTVPPFARDFKSNLTLVLWDKAEGKTYNVSVTAVSEDGKTTAHGFILITVLRPDLYVTQDGIVLDYDLVVGVGTTFTVKVFNGGPVDSPAPNLTVYDRSHQVIFTARAASSIRAGGFSEVTVKWTPTFKGQDELTFVVNEDKRIIEVAYENNSITRAVTIFQPNLKIEDTDILFYVEGKETNKLTDGQQVSITVQIRNSDTYSYKAKDVLVEFYVDGVRVANRTVDVVLANNIQYAQVDWKAKTGSHTVMVKLDPNNAINMQDRSYTQASRKITVKQKTTNFTVGPLAVGVAIAVGLIILIAYGVARGVISSPVRKSQVEFADKRYRCNECGELIKKGTRYYHCACGVRSHVKCAKRAELCECLRRVRIV